MIRRAVDADIPALDRLLFQVHQVHHEARPDLFKAGAKKYTDAQLSAILADDKTPVFVAERGGAVVGYAFCIHKQFVNDNNMTDIKRSTSTTCAWMNGCAAGISARACTNMCWTLRVSRGITT